MIKLAVIAVATGLRRAPSLRAKSLPLFLRPAELAVGLALKELRYGTCFGRFAPETCKGLCGSSAPGRSDRPGFGTTGAAV
jgi:hypothetical protein